MEKFTTDKTFSDIEGLDPWIIKELKKMGMEKPTPIQCNCIPKALQGKDVIGAAKTGSGKTLAFVIPILQKLSVDPYGIFALVLTPSKELAFQIGDQFSNLGAPMRLRVTVLVGGLSMVKQGFDMSRLPHVVVATPGRLFGLLQYTPEFSLKRIQFLVVDEADRLFDGTYDRHLKGIWDDLPERRQTLLFSATISDRLKKMQQHAKSDVYIYESSDSNQLTVEKLKEQYVLTRPSIKDAAMLCVLINYMEEHPKNLVLIFTDTCQNTQVVHMMMNKLGMRNLRLHSLMSTQERMEALDAFKSSRTRVLIATDLASRGLDIPKVGLVINHCIPSMTKSYVHRVGRTARAGRSGVAISFVEPTDLRLMMAIEIYTKRKLTELKVPLKQIEKIVREVNLTKRTEQICLEQSDFLERKKIRRYNQKILDGRDPDEEERLISEKRKMMGKMRKQKLRQLSKKAKVEKEPESQETES